MWWGRHFASILMFQSQFSDVSWDFVSYKFLAILRKTFKRFVYVSLSRKMHCKCCTQAVGSLFQSIGNMLTLSEQFSNDLELVCRDTCVLEYFPHLKHFKWVLVYWLQNLLLCLFENTRMQFKNLKEFNT